MGLPMTADQKTTPTASEVYDDFQTAIAMAKSEGMGLRSIIEQEIERLRAMANQLEEWLQTNPTYEIDSWYETVLKRRKELQL
jgi:hypothetical protein